MPFLWFVRCLTYILVVACVSSRENEDNHLAKVYHHQLFTEHGLTSSAKVYALAQSHKDDAILRNSSQPLPFLGCGPAHSSSPSSISVEQKEQQIGSLVGPSRVHVARDIAEQGEVCLLLLASSDHIRELTSDDWTFVPVPHLVKIHHDVLSLLAQEKPLHVPQSSPLHPSPQPPDQMENEEAVEWTGEGLELVVQFFPGSDFSSSDWEALLQSWSRQQEATRLFQSHLTAASTASTTATDNKAATVTPSGNSGDHDDGWANDSVKHVTVDMSPWEAMREKHSQLTAEKGSSFSHCVLPTSSAAEFHLSDQARGGISVGKLVDLSGWRRDIDSSDREDTSSLFCLVKLVEVLSAQPSVLSVSILPRPTLLNYDARGLVQSGSATSSPLTKAGLRGEGQVVGVADSGLDDKSCYFYDNSQSYSSAHTTRSSTASSTVSELNRRKVVQYTSYADGYDNAAGHGTHVVGSIVGSSLSADFSRANGIAPSAKVAFFDIQTGGQAYLHMPALASSLFPALYSSGAEVFSNSWGTAGSGYSDKSYDVDYFTYNNPRVLILFAAGNSGAVGAGSAFNPCSSKNALCVGSVDSRNDQDDGVLDSSRVSYFSSQGPTSDGRSKPDVVAPGFKVVSALSGGPSGGDMFCGVYETFGTSMATPITAGGALLLRDYFQNLWPAVCQSSYSFCHSFSPTGYLLKALIVHSGQAVDSYSESSFDAKTSIASHSLGNRPDSVQGYGQVNLHSVIPLTVSERKSQDLYIEDTFPMSGQRTASLSVLVSSNKHPLKVTLLWYDRPSVVGNTQNLLVVNLDLQVTDPSGRVRYGNGVQGDSLNPQEQVEVSSPEKGVHTVRVVNVGSYATNCALVITCNGQVTHELTLGDDSALATDTAATASTITAAAAAAAAVAATSAANIAAPTGPATTTAVTAAATSLFSNFDLVKSFTLHHTLTANQQVLLKTFDLPDSSLELFSVELNLDAQYCSGSEAFILAVIVQAPNGELVQLGGYNEYSSLDRLWHRMWPVQWTAASAPPDGGSSWRSTRYVVDMQIAQKGTYAVYVELMHESWPDTVYHGNVKLNFVDEATALNRSKSPGGFFSSSGAIAAGLVIFLLMAAAVFSAGLVIRKRKQNEPKADAGGKKRHKPKEKSKKAKRGDAKKNISANGHPEVTPWSHLSGLLADQPSSNTDNGDDHSTGQWKDVENPLSLNRDKGGVGEGSEEKSTVVRHKRYKSARKKDASA